MGEWTCLSVSAVEILRWLVRVSLLRLTWLRQSAFTDRASMCDGGKRQTGSQGHQKVSSPGHGNECLRRTECGETSLQV